MNKLDLALSFLEKSILSGKLISVESAFNLANDFESEAIQRNLYIPDRCPKCHNEVKTIDLSTQNDPCYRVSCLCVKKQHKDLSIAFQEWWNYVR